MPLRTRIVSAASLGLLTASLLLAGCSIGMGPTSAFAPTQSTFGPIHGSVYGGRTPIGSAGIFVMQASTSGYGVTTTGTVGSASTSLLVAGGDDVTGKDGTMGSLTYGDYYVATDSHGNFSLDTSDYTCTSGAMVYLYSRSGIAITSGAADPQIGLMAALGPCPAAGTFAGNLPYIYMNEVSTVAMAYAFAGFTFDPVHIGSSGSTLAVTGLNNAAQTMLNLYNLYSPAIPNILDSAGANATTPNYVSGLTVSGGAGYTVAPTVAIDGPGPGGTQATATATVSGGTVVLSIVKPGSGYLTAPNVQLAGGTYTTAATATATIASNGTVPQQLINTISNILVSCINSGNTAAASTTQCNNLRAYATNTGTAGTVVVAPAITGFGAAEANDTATAAINIARHPGSNVTNLYNVPASGPATVYTPALTAVPNDFAVDITYTGSGTTSTRIVPHGLAVDSSGNVWRTSFGSSAATSLLKEMNPMGSPILSLTNVNGLNEPDSVAIDTSGNAWVANYGGSTVSEFTSTGGTATGSPFTNGDVLNPTDAELDNSGNVWVSDGTADGFLELSSSGAELNVIANSAYIEGPYSVAITPTDVWVCNSVTTGSGKNANGFTLIDTPNPPAGSFNYFSKLSGKMYGAAIDSSSNVWVTFASTYFFAGTSSAAYEIAANSKVKNVSVLAGIAFDGANDTWIADSANGALYEYDNLNLTTGTVTTLSPTAGYIAPGNTACTTTGCTRTTEPNAVAVDPSGNVWYTTTNDGTLHEKVGIGAPVVTPLAEAVTNSTIATRP